jgi:carboxypeptidase D
MASIQKQNKKAVPPPLHIQLSGAAIGNGWMDPYHQYATADAAYGHGLVGIAQRNALAAKEKECQAQLDKGNYRFSVCMRLLNDVVNQSFGSSSRWKVSQ